MKIETKDFNLDCLRCSFYELLDKKTNLVRRTVYDYELEYYTESQGGIEIDGEYVPFKEGDVNFRVPGQKVLGVLPYKCYTVCIQIVAESKKALNYYAWGKKSEAQKRYENEILSKLPFKIENAKSTEKLFKNIYKAFLIKDELAVKGNLYRLFWELNELVNQVTEKKYIGVINKAIIYINKNFSTPLSMREIASYLGISTNYFQSLFAEHVGITPNRYLNTVRINHAKYLLKNTKMSIAEISQECGIYDTVYFSQVFKKETGLTPSAFRNEE